MKTLKTTFQKMKHSAAILSIICITVIGGYGILQAPEKKANAGQLKLEQELARNAAALELQSKEMDFSEENLRQKQEEMANMQVPPQATEDLAQNHNQAAAENHPNQKSASHQSHTNTQAAPQKITAIGDSVLLGASPAVKKRFSKIFIDAKISRQVYQAQEIAKNLKKNGQLWDTVIIALGTNGNFNKKTGQDLIDYIGKKRKIYWINVHGKSVSWQKTVNQTIQELSEENENVTVIDWAKEAPSHEGWFYGDGIHLNTTGQRGYAKFLKKSLLASA